MTVTEAMLDAALRKATEAGLFPRHCSADELAANREVMRGILFAAMNDTALSFMENTVVEPRSSSVPSIARSH